jgi:hypothetical protein
MMKYLMITKDVEPYTVVEGNLAHVIRKRFDDETVKFHSFYVDGIRV